MFKNFKPLDDKILVQIAQKEAKTQGGIYIPESAQEKTQQGKVLAVGPGRLGTNGNRIIPAVKVGDTIFYGKYAGTETDAEHIILREEDVLGIIEE